MLSFPCRFLPFVLAVVLAPCGVFGSVIYTGSISSTGYPGESLEGFGGYDYGVKVAWTVSQDASSDPWLYEYIVTLHKCAPELSHLILETCPDFDTSCDPAENDDLLSFSYPSEGDPALSIGLQGQVPGNRNLPSPVFGLKFDNVTPDAEGGLVYTFSLVSWRAPEWGDIYGKGGRRWGITSTFHNGGLTATDWDPDPACYPAGNGSVWEHVLVPGCKVVPEPSTLALAALGLFALVIRRRAR